MFKERIKGHHTGGGGSKPVPATEEELFEFLQGTPERKDGIIYFHIPFCDNICSFCSMNRSKLEGELDTYTEFLLSEIEKFGKFPYMKAKNIESVYFGGGTPTVLKEKHLDPIINAIHKNFKISPTCEFSLESTLHNLSPKKLKLLDSLGVNRFSIGVQTFSDDGRKLLNRVFDKEEALKRLKQIRDNFDKFVCIDIIYNYPGETVEEVLEDARIVKELKIDSVSFYSLMFSQGSVLSKEISPDYYSLETDKELHHAFANSLLDSGDYEVLEHTKINRKNRDEYKYIRLGHKGEDTLPIGFGAGGRLGNYSMFAMNKERRMITKTNETQRNFGKFMSLFQYPNVKFSDMSQYIKPTTLEEIKDFLKLCEKHDYMKVNDHGATLNIEGVFWGNTMAAEISKIARKDFE